MSPSPPAEANKRPRSTADQAATKTQASSANKKNKTPPPTPPPRGTSKILDHLRTQRTIQNKQNDDVIIRASQSQNPHAAFPSESKNHHHKTTIRLPRAPKPAPSPISPTSFSHRTPHPRPYPATTTTTTQKKPPARIIEPTPNTALPAKYRPAARRVTAIIVGLPFVIVMGWELFERWRGKEVRTRFGGEGGRRVEDR